MVASRFSIDSGGLQLCRLTRHGQINLEAGSLRLMVLHLYPASPQLGKLPDDMQSQASTGKFGVSLLRGIKLVEDMRFVCIRYSDTRIPHLDAELCILPMHPDACLASCGRVLDSIGEQVVENFSHLVLVESHLNLLFLCLHRQD